MAFSPAEAAEIALRHGLSLSDAAGLSRLATTPEEAESLARSFTQPRQLSRADIAGWKPAAILEAKEAGQLRELLGQGGE